MNDRLSPSDIDDHCPTDKDEASGISLTAAGAGGTGTTAAGERLFTGHSETTTAATASIPFLNEIHFDGTTGGKQGLVHHKADPVMVKGPVILLDLILGKPQGGPGTASGHRGDSNGRIDLMLAHVIFDVTQG